MNIVYSASFAGAWESLKSDILREEVRLGETLKLVEELNLSASYLPVQEHSLNLSGFVAEGIIEKIESQMQKRFDKIVDLSEFGDIPTNIVCYSYFEKEIKFDTPLEKFDSPFPFFYSNKSVEVECFGIWTAGRSAYHMKLRELIKILYHYSPTEFIVSFNNRGEPDEIIIALIEPGETLRETIALVNRKIRSSKSESLVNNDRLVIPKLKLNISREYTELYGKRLLNKGFEDYFFTAAAQTVSLELNERGASADSEAKLILKKGPGPRTMIVNRPFLLMMRERGSERPYLAVWIENPDHLLKSN
jgi:hypothetical protein